MKSRIRAMSTRMGVTVASASLLAVAVAGGSISTAAAKSSRVNISVVSLIPGSTKAAFTQFNNQVAEFQKANPSIKVHPSSTSGSLRRSRRSSPRARCRQCSPSRSRTGARSARTVSSPT